MIRHIVIFQLDEVEATQEKLQEIKSALENLVEFIPVLSKMEVGINVNPDEKQQLVLVADIASLEDVDVYAKHPKHLEAAALIKPIAKLRTCVDYEIA